MNDQGKLTLIVPGEAESKPRRSPRPKATVEDVLPGSGDEPEDHAWFPVRLFHRTDDVEMGKLRDDLATLQGQLAQLLGGIDPKVDGYHLKTVDVELAITAQGSIGVVTASVTPSITLSFERAQ